MWFKHKIEDIPSNSIVYRRFHKHCILKDVGNIRPLGSFFSLKANETYLSINWNKYCLTPKDSINLAKVPSDNGAVSINVGDIYKINGVFVRHIPNGLDKSHSGICSNYFELYDKIQQTRIRNELASIAKIELLPGNL